MNKIAFVTGIAVNMWIGGCTYGANIRPNKTEVQSNSELSTPLRKTRKEYEVADANSFWQSPCGTKLLKLFKKRPTHNELLSLICVITKKISNLEVGRSERRCQGPLFEFIKGHWEQIEPHLQFIRIEYENQDSGTNVNS